MAFDLYQNTSIGDTTTYIRPYQTVSLGPLAGPSSVIISEEMVVVLPDASTRIVQLSTDPLQATIADPNQAFDIVDPITGDVTGTTTFAQLHIQMYSLYLYLAGLRDEA